MNTFISQRVPTFTPEQERIFNVVIEAVEKNDSLLAFIDARGGCGKTYLLNTILSAVRKMESGSTALAMATTGIAATLLDLGRTFHSRMKAELNPSEESFLSITHQSHLAELIRTSKLLMIDEATMLDRYHFEAMDRTLRDITGKMDKPFGGKIVILAGDFRQCLPVVKGATRAQIVNRCINKSHLWGQFKIMKLTENMRVRASGDHLLEQFDQWTLGIGNGESEKIQIPPNMLATRIISNTKNNRNSEGQSMEQFCQIIFPDLNKNINNLNWLDGRAILATTNKEVKVINDLIISWLPGKELKFYSADYLENTDDVLRFNEEYLNSLTPKGFPPHVLTLKKGMPLMLIRNLNPRIGLCNGTRLFFDKMHTNKMLQCSVVGSDIKVFIPRITFLPQKNEFPFSWTRRQFPVKPSFAMTINKSQGQTLKYCGIWLRSEIFTHGQLYVASSRNGNPSSLKFAVPMKNLNQVNNIVYKEVLRS